MDPTAQNVMLFRWDRFAKTAERIGDKQGFHGAPVFSADGTRIRFAHHPDKGGPPGFHKEGAFAQLYEQELATGTLRKLTDTPGCHMESTGSDARLYFAHANCMGGRRIEVLSAGKALALTQFDDHHGEPRISKDGKRLIVTKVVGDVLTLLELDPSGKKKERTLWSGMRVGDRFRPAFLEDGRVIFQIAGKVQVVGKNGTTVVASY
jgi:Tol biopolymer transport system component